MRKFNKALSVVLAVLMLCAMMPFGAMVSAAGDIINKELYKNDYINTLLRCRENGFTYTNNEFLLMPNRDDSAKEDHYLTMEEIVKLSKERTSLDKELLPIDCTPEPCGCGTEPPKGLTCKAGSCTSSMGFRR